MKQNNLLKKAEKYALEKGALVKDRTDGKPTTIENIRAVAEVNAMFGYIDGYREAMSKALSCLAKRRKEGKK